MPCSASLPRGLLPSLSLPPNSSFTALDAGARPRATAISSPAIPSIGGAFSAFFCRGVYPATGSAGGSDGGVDGRALAASPFFGGAGFGFGSDVAFLGDGDVTFAFGETGEVGAFASSFFGSFGGAGTRVFDELFVTTAAGAGLAVGPVDTFAGSFFCGLGGLGAGEGSNSSFLPFLELVEESAGFASDNMDLRSVLLTLGSSGLCG